jgi:hypothetical protein
MTNTDLSLQLVFLGVAIVTFLAPYYVPQLHGKLHERVNPLSESNIGKALLAFSAGGLVQLIPTWLGNVLSDSAGVWLVTHVISGVIFGAGAWVAAQFIQADTGKRGA